MLHIQCLTSSAFAPLSSDVRELHGLFFGMGLDNRKEIDSQKVNI